MPAVAAVTVADEDDRTTMARSRSPARDPYRYRAPSLVRISWSRVPAAEMTTIGCHTDPARVPVNDGPTYDVRDVDLDDDDSFDDSLCVIGCFAVRALTYDASVNDVTLVEDAAAVEDADLDDVHGSSGSLNDDHPVDRHFGTVERLDRMNRSRQNCSIASPYWLTLPL